MELLMPLLNLYHSPGFPLAGPSSFFPQVFILKAFLNKPLG